MRGGPAAPAVLLDTCALIWLVNGDPMARPALEAIRRAGAGGGIFASPISAWEIGLLGRSRRNGAPRFLPDPRRWFAAVMTGPGIRTAPFTPAIAIDSSSLPGELHGDPADRIIISTARHLGVPVVTRDRRIVAYADAGHLQAVLC